MRLRSHNHNDTVPTLEQPSYGYPLSFVIPGVEVSIPPRFNCQNGKVRQNLRYVLTPCDLEYPIEVTGLFPDTTLADNFIPVDELEIKF